MLHLFATVLTLYVVLRLVLPLRVSPRAKVGLSLLVLVCSMKLYLLRLAFDSVVPEISRPLMLSLGYLHGSLVLLTVCCVLRDAMLLVLKGLSRILPGIPGNPLSPGQWAAALLCISLALGGAAIRQGVAEPGMHAFEITVPGLPKELDGLRIVHASDLHISPTFPQERTAAVVNLVNSRNPDLILLTGDLVDGTVQDRMRDVAPLAGLKARLGVLMCPGNHEYYWDWPAWRRAFEDLGITTLENAHAVIDAEGGRIVVAGVADRAAERFGLPGPDPAEALAHSPANALRVLLAHRPQVVYAAAGEEVDIQLSGHTHGGQLAVVNLLVGAFNSGFISGLYPTGGTLLNVTNGVALWSGFPLRLLVPSRFDVLTLKAPAASG